ncbi:ribonuclease H protein [Canna indica]|uniref:Ribonuclease H protein n=1 Tax=Canna indica TaxID=4628 RepID=A0AAQ3L545_9LILI|nr:ribonuclease H protein [Canna indica]
MGINDCFVHWYRDIWKEENFYSVGRTQLSKLDWSTLPSSTHHSMIDRISEYEIISAMNSLGKGKAPGPDEFNLEFYLKFWEIIRYMEAINTFYNEAVKEVIAQYDNITDQKINFDKSECFFPRDYSHEKNEELCTGIKGLLPFKYLGSNIDKSKTPLNFQRQIISKAETKLNSWASRNISQAGKIVLLNFVINSIFVHTLASSWISDKVVKEYVKAARNYFWKSNAKAHSFYLVNRKKLTLSKTNGGLGIRDLNIYLPKEEVKDTWIWSLNNKGKLTCKVAYNYLKNEESEDLDTTFDWKLLWSLDVLPKIKIFVWKLVQDRLPTFVWLANKSKIEPHCCYVCGKNQDDTNHIFFECTMAVNLWNSLGKLLNIHFEFRDFWSLRKWMNEGIVLDKKDKITLVSCIATGL